MPIHFEQLQFESPMEAVLRVWLGLKRILLFVYVWRGAQIWKWIWTRLTRIAERGGRRGEIDSVGDEVGGGVVVIVGGGCGGDGGSVGDGNGGVIGVGGVGIVGDGVGCGDGVGKVV
jgi:hypothetical protein